MRVLITGSRNWGDWNTIAEELSNLPAGSNTLISGACPTGADRMAEQVAEILGWQIERHPADWKTHGKRAGFLRNAEMVASGADLCLAFIQPCNKISCPDGPAPHDSHGAAQTVKLATEAGIRTAVHRRRFPRLAAE